MTMFCRDDSMFNKEQRSIAYTGKDNYGKPKSDYLNKLKAMSDDTLYRETEMKIWLSAYASNNANSDYHWHSCACCDEWRTRQKGERYWDAYAEAKKTWSQ